MKMGDIVRLNKSYLGRFSGEERVRKESDNNYRVGTVIGITREDKQVVVVRFNDGRTDAVHRDWLELLSIPTFTEEFRL